MDVREAIRTVLAVRAYRDESVPEYVIRDILEAGRLTASASNKQPWHFVVVRNRELLQAVADNSDGHGPYIAGADFAVVVLTDSPRFGLSDASRAIQDMFLAAWAHGVGSNWVGFPGMLDAIKPVLGIPDELEIVAVLPFGYPANEELGKGRKKRKPFDDIVHWETWGNHTAPGS
jgi:nitroreductase